ncbi:MULTISPECIES: hypothetical protein [unclassified Aureispira]|uniref:hypothetical protein n=1 Tax=unclassified Aureispira TaxID=2649989 RepID=UPI000695CE1D|nr:MULTISPECIES: hypothetical protein [unclassified Aureispira]WMX13549.1 hypothetical protein QP953_22115 [Aureispira sp. CCB-E]
MKKTVDKNVLNSIKEIIKGLVTAYKTNKEVTPEMIEQMKAMRELFKELEQPTIVKSIRLAYEHIGNHGSLDNLPYWEEEEIELDEENSSFEYYLGLLTNPTNKYNREEIKELNVLLKEIAEA